MATSFVNVTGSWTQVQAGPSDSVAIQPESGVVMYQVAAATPTANEGHRVTHSPGHTIGLDTGENLYARSESGSTIRLAVTV